MQIDQFTQELQQRVEAIIGGAADSGLRSQLVSEALQAALNSTATHNFNLGQKAAAPRRPRSQIGRFWPTPGLI